MTEAEFISIAKRPPSEFERRMNGIPDSPRDIAAPGAWPWPMSEEARKWVVESLEHNALLKRLQQKQEPQFNRIEHERFMRSLG